MKILFAVVLFAFASHSVQATEMNLKVFESLKGRFSQVKVLNELGVEIKTEGSFSVYRKDPKAAVFNWSVEKPKKSEVCLDSAGVVLNSGGKKKKIAFSEIGEDSGQQMTSLLKLVSLDPKGLDEEFIIKEEGPEFRLTPKKTNTVFFKYAQVHVNSAGLVDKIFVKEKSDDELKIQFSDLMPQKAQVAVACAP